MSGSRQIVPVWPPREWHKGRAQQLRENAAGSRVSGKVLRQNVVELAEIILEWYREMEAIDKGLRVATKAPKGCELCGTPRMVVEALEELARGRES